MSSRQQWYVMMTAVLVMSFVLGYHFGVWMTPLCFWIGTITVLVIPRPPR